MQLSVTGFAGLIAIAPGLPPFTPSDHYGLLRGNNRPLSVLTPLKMPVIGFIFNIDKPGQEKTGDITGCCCGRRSSRILRR